MPQLGSEAIVCYESCVFLACAKISALIEAVGFFTAGEDFSSCQSGCKHQINRTLYYVVPDAQANPSHSWANWLSPFK